MEKFQDVDPSLAGYGGDFLLVKGVIGSVYETLQVSGRYIVAEETDDAERQLAVREVLP
jgi:hypothetical protein